VRDMRSRRISFLLTVLAFHALLGVSGAAFRPPLRMDRGTVQFLPSFPRGGRGGRGSEVHTEPEHDLGLLMDVKSHPQLQIKTPQPQSVKERSFLKAINNIGVSIFFWCMVLRSLAALEGADHLPTSINRVVVGVPLLLLFIGNVLGLAANILKPVRFKRYMKSVMFLNFIRELGELLLNVVFIGYSLLRRHSTFVNTDSIFLYTSGRMFGNVYQNIFWMLICLQYLKSHWV
jgi:hypothetical protein